MPKGIAADAAPAPAGRRNLLAAVGIPLLIVGTAAASFAWNALQVRNNLPGGGIVNTGGAQQEQFWSLFTTTAFPEVTSTPTRPAAPPLANCPLPGGWTPYTVAPTDSLYRLAIIYGVTVEDLQRINCMGDATAILPGQVIYVPLLPTPTPSLTPTKPVVVPIVVATADPGGGGEKPRPARPTPRPTRRPPTVTPVPPTEVPPTLVPTTDVPPTALPPTTVPPTAVPPTALPGIETVVPTPEPSKTPKPKPTKKPKGNGSDGQNTLDGSGGIIDQIQGILGW